MKGVSKLSEKCKKCSHVNDCDKKRMMACGLMKTPENALSLLSSALTTPVAAESMVKHDYLDVKINDDTTKIIDVERIKKDLERSIYKAFGCAFEFGA